MKPCYCGHDKEFSKCCEPYLKGTALPETAEQLMRSRYSAFATKNTAYLEETLTPESRQSYDEQAVQQWVDHAAWLGLEILATEKGKKNDEEGMVEFVAKFQIQGATKNHHERAEFLRQDGRWYLQEGNLVKPQPIRVEKIGRNEPCPCGSGSKYKKCCGVAA